MGCTPELSLRGRFAPVAISRTNFRIPQISDSRQQAAALQADVASAQQANLALEQDIANVGTDEAVMKIARERLNLVEDGEMIFIDSDK